MNPVQYILMALDGIARLTINPALGGGGYRRERIVQLLGALAVLVEGVQHGRRELIAFAEEVKALADAGVEPSRGQWEALMARDVAARVALAEARERLGYEPEPEQNPEPQTPEPQPEQPPADEQLPDPALNG